MKVAVATLGCKANQYDSACIEESIRRKGWSIVPPTQDADAYIVNTCTVTQRADMQCRQLLRRLRRDHRDSKVIATGCYAEVEPQALHSIPGIDAVIGLKHRENIPAFLENPHENTVLTCAMSPEYTFFGPTAASFRTRAFFKVQDGCDHRCSFCIIPRARGRSRSLDPEGVIQGLTSYQENGVEEVVLTGIHLGAYGRDLDPKTSLVDLLKRINPPPVPPLFKGGMGGVRIRLSSLDPHEVTHDLLNIVSSSQSLCRHLHVSLQSGDKGVLRAMNRPPLSGDFFDALLAAKERMPDMCVGVDVIAGFSGETQEAFENTYRLIESLPVSYLHVFPFSRRRGTPAADMSNRVSSGCITERAGLLRALGFRKREEFVKPFLGERVRVLVERSRDSRTLALTGYTGNYIRVFFPGGDGLMGRSISVRIVRQAHGKVYGKPC